ncbi:hypothetical protein DSO57_1008467 [Entomophthora muscae]|uniref:Uncharacterized protein n=1 Tax=Entomophthora muscae TaxID=34485 RepID=A0ACC2U551_9FUNG|nr:hypothetical protein DSO57_1008467 [Entomophthora muscae]
MSSSSNNQVNKVFPGLDKIIQGYTRSSNNEASVYVHPQLTGSSSSTIQDYVISPASSSIARFAHHTHAAANPNPIFTLVSEISQLSSRIILGSQNKESANHMTSFDSQGRHIPPPANQSARRRRKLINPKSALEMVKKRLPRPPTLSANPPAPSQAPASYLIAPRVPANCKHPPRSQSPLLN